jgi:probable aminopeptidase NPEPL1
MVAANIVFEDIDKALKGADAIVVIGLKDRLGDDDVLSQLAPGYLPVWKDMVASLSAKDSAASTSTWVTGKKPLRLMAGVLPSSCSRHNTPSRSHSITSLLRRAPSKGKKLAVIIALSSKDHAFASACAVGRAYSKFSLKSSTETNKKARKISVAYLAPDGKVAGLKKLAAAADAVRDAGQLVDMPTSVLCTEAFVNEAKKVAESTGAACKVISGKTLDKMGFGGLWGVGKAAVKGPALVILSHEPKKTGEAIAWVGKGIVYDTGGLSIKGKGNMPGMKADMGGAAAVLFAFRAALERGYKGRLYAVLCLAENSVGPDSTRPDDVLHMYSGKTVEVNNTDAEGRLVLADGVAYAVKDLKADVIVDLATLTGAQMVATGKRHAGIVSNSATMEARTVEAGRSSGDLVHPLPYCPEFFRDEFSSKIADMKNSVKSRANAQSSCAAQFVANHLGDFKGDWLHVDMAGPAGIGDRGTGYGVALLLDLFGA